jgi:putative transposase
MGALMIKRMKELEDKNRRLKKMFAEEKLVGEIACEALVKKW